MYSFVSLWSLWIEKLTAVILKSFLPAFMQEEVTGDLWEESDELKSQGMPKLLRVLLVFWRAVELCAVLWERDCADRIHIRSALSRSLSATNEVEEFFDVLLHSDNPWKIGIEAFVNARLASSNLGDGYNFSSLVPALIEDGVQMIESGEQIHNPLAWSRKAAHRIILEKQELMKIEDQLRRLLLEEINEDLLCEFKHSDRKRERGATTSRRNRLRQEESSVALLILAQSDYEQQQAEEAWVRRRRWKQKLLFGWYEPTGIYLLVSFILSTYCLQFAKLMNSRLDRVITRREREATTRSSLT